MKEFNIRTVTPSDDAILAKIIRDTFDEYNAPHEGTVYTDSTTDCLSSVFVLEKSACFVAYSEEEVHGCCGIYPTEGLPNDYAELVKFYLKPSSRGIGIGKALMEKCEHEAVLLGYKSLYLESLPAFGQAVNIYLKLGYEQIKTPMGHSGHHGCNIWMVKSLF